MKVGDKVVCIKRFRGVLLISGEPSPHEPLPIKGNTYTVSHVRNSGALFLEELNSIYPYNREKFRPIQPKRRTNALSAKLAKELIEYNPIEVEPIIIEI